MGRPGASTRKGEVVWGTQAGWGPTQNVYVGNDPVNFVDPGGLYNLVKGGVGAINGVRGLLSVATGAAAIIAGTATLPFIGVNLVGVGAMSLGVVRVGLGVANINRGAQQMGEAMNEEWGEVSARNLFGLAPFGQEFDDPWEPEPVEYFTSAAENFDIGDWLRDLLAFEAGGVTANGRR